MPVGSSRNTPMRLNRNATLPVAAMLPPPLLKWVRMLATVRVGLSVAASTSTAMPCGRVAFVDDLVVGRRVLACRALDRRLDLVLRHVDGARVLDDAAERGIGVRIGAAGLHRDDDVLADPGELLRHPVPAGEHRVLAGFENASHGRWIEPRPRLRVKARSRRAASVTRGEGRGCSRAWRSRISATRR